MQTVLWSVTATLLLLYAEWNINSSNFSKCSTIQNRDLTLLQILLKDRYPPLSVVARLQFSGQIRRPNKTCVFKHRANERGADTQHMTCWDTSLDSVINAVHSLCIRCLTQDANDFSCLYPMPQFQLWNWTIFRPVWLNNPHCSQQYNLLFDGHFSVNLGEAFFVITQGRFWRRVNSWLEQVWVNDEICWIFDVWGWHVWPISIYIFAP